MPLVSFTRATLRSAEFGFFGVVVYTRVQTPRRWGLPLSAADFCLAALSWRPFRTSCWIVGNGSAFFSCCYCSRLSCLRLVRSPRAGGSPRVEGRLPCDIAIGLAEEFLRSARPIPLPPTCMTSTRSGPTTSGTDVKDTRLFSGSPIGGGLKHPGAHRPATAFAIKVYRSRRLTSTNATVWAGRGAEQATTWR